MNNFRSWAQDLRWYKQLRIMDNINEDAMNSSGFYFTSTTPGRELKALDT